MVADRTFRQDLYYRLRVVEIAVPPLRARGADEIEQLARHFVELFSKRYGRPPLTLDAETIAALAAYDWPGNVRELEHWVESSVALSRDGQVLEPPRPGPRRSAADDRPGIVVPLGLTMDDVERRYIAATVDACGGNQTEAAKRLGIGRNTLGRAIKASKTRPG
jgi:Nif-specific regulatory protein